MENENKSLEDIFNEVETTPARSVAETEHIDENTPLDFDQLDAQLKAEEEKNKSEQQNKEVVEDVKPENKTEEKDKAEEKPNQEVKNDDKKNLSLQEIEEAFDKKFKEQEQLKENARIEKEKADKEIAEKLKLEEDAKKEKEKLESDEKFDGTTLFDEEDKKSLEYMKENFPDLERGLKAYDKKIRAEYEKKLQVELTKSIKYVYDNVMQYVAPVYQSYEQQVFEKKTAEFTNAHPDYKEHQEGIEKWIIEQPESIKDAFTKTYTQGDVKELTTLFTMYKKYNGIGATVEQPKPVDKQSNDQQQQAQNKQVVDDKKKALGAVSSKNNTNAGARKDGEMSNEELFNIL